MAKERILIKNGTLGNHSLTECSEYKYLGIMFSRAWTRVEVATTLISTCIIRPAMGMGVLTDSNKRMWFISQQGRMYGNIQ